MNAKLNTFMRGSRFLFLVLSLVLVGAASANPQGSARVDADYYSDHHHHQHGSVTGHLPETTLNVDLVGKLKVTNFEGDIADVSALQAASNGKWYAYLADWGAKCQTGGVHVVDISDPANPVKIGFLNAGGTAYQTEGVQALHIETTDFTGDILVVSNEWCIAKSNPKLNQGGISIWDITDPTNPELLVDGFGDFDLHGNRANEAHSAIAWDAGDGDAYVAVIDNEEDLDVDLVEITDPSNPVLLAETGLPNWPDAETNANGQLSFAHDYDVIQKPDGTWHLMVSYWDTGWVDLDVTDPSNPVFIEDFTYAACDQVVPTACPPEGNAHQGEWNADGTLFIGTDEDFDPYRTTPLARTTGPGSPETYSTVPVGGAPVTILPDLRLNGPVAYGGYGCPSASAPIPPADSIFPPGSLEPGEEQIIVLQRGPADDPNNPEAACFPGEKADNATDQGWDAVVLTGRHLAGGAAADDPPNCGFGAFPADEQIVAVCTTHTAMHELFSRPVDFTLPYPLGDPGDLEPNIGDVGFEVDITSEFDGWGYVRLFDSNPAGGFTEIAQLTIPQTADPAFALGFGDITIHEVEVPRGDPNEGGSHPDDGVLAYFSWYSGGFRVASYDASGITEVGRYIDPEGNNFWGVALAEDQNGDRIILASDRDYGLFIFRYTGP
jgi:hypothetical protein